MTDWLKIGNNAVITGGASGIGCQAFVPAMLEAGQRAAVTSTFSVRTTIRHASSTRSGFSGTRTI